MRKIVPLLVMLSILLISTYGQVVAGSELYKQHEINYETRNFNPNTDVNRNFDPSNPRQSDFSVMQWEYDFRATGTEAPKGVYVGQYLNPSVLELDYKPVWNPQRVRHISGNSRVTESLGTYGVTLISTQVRFSSSEIMNGASEFWVRLPAFAHQLETINLERESYSTTTGNRTTVQSTINSGIYLYQGGYNNFSIDGDETMGIFDLRADSNTTSIANGIISKENNNYNNSLYHRFNVVVNSDITYTIAFLMISREKPYIMLDEVESSNSQIDYKVVSIDDVYLYDGYTDWMGILIDRRSYNHLLSDVSTSDSTSKDLLIEPHFSFIFTKGLGENNMFGYSLPDNSSIKINMRYDGFEGVSSEKYPSVYIPFLLDDIDGITPPINLKLGISQYDDDPGTLLFVYDEDDELNEPVEFPPNHALYNWYVNGTYEYIFTNYLLFSTTDLQTPTGVYDIQPKPDILYNELIINNLPQSLTFLCRENTEKEYSKLPSSTNQTVSSFWMGETFTRNGGDFYLVEEEIIDGSMNRIVSTDYTQYGERYFYEIFTSLDFTEGRWNTIKLPAQTVVLSWSEMELRGISNNTIIKGRHRPYIITGRNETTANINTGDTEDSSIWDMEWSWTNIGANMLAFGTWVLNHIINGMRTMVDSLWRGVESLWAFIQTIPQRVYDGLEALGTWITRVVTEFFAQILEILGDLWELGGLYLQAFSHILAFMLFFLVLYAVIKIIASTEVRLFDRPTH